MKKLLVVMFSMCMALSTVALAQDIDRLQDRTFPPTPVVPAEPGDRHPQHLLQSFYLLDVSHL